MEEEKTLTLKSLEKQVKEQFADINKKLSELERNQDYYDIEDQFYKNSQKYDCEPLTKSCYRNLLENYFGLSASRGYGRTVQQVANTFPNNRVIMRLHGHLTVSDFGGVIKDIFDCSHEIVDEFWVVK